MKEAIINQIMSLCAVLALISCNGNTKEGNGINSNNTSSEEPTVFVIGKNEKFGLMDSQGKALTPISYNAIIKLSEEYYYVRDGLKWKVMSVNGEEVIPSSILDRFNIGWLSEGLFIVNEKKGNCGAIDAEGNVVIPCIYDELFHFSEGLALVHKNGKAGFIDLNGQEVVPCIYDYGSDFTEGIASVQQKGKWGAIDRTGNVVIDFKYESISRFIDGFAVVEKESKNGFINKKGEIVVPIIYDSFSYYNCFIEGMAYPCDKTNWCVGLVNCRGEQVAPCIYKSIGTFNEGIAVYEKNNNKRGYINKLGEEINSFENVRNFSEGLAAVRNQGQFGFINSSFKEVIPYSFSDAGEFHEGYASVKKGYKWGFINTKGDIMVPCEYDEVFSFSNGCARVKKNGKYGYVNTHGVEVAPCKYDIALDFSKGFGTVYINGMEGRINTKGEEIIPCEYSFISSNCML